MIFYDGKILKIANEQDHKYSQMTVPDKNIAQVLQIPICENQIFYERHHSSKFPVDYVHF